MSTAYFHCHSGISGDMILGALLDAGIQLDRLGDELKKLDLTGYRLGQNRVHRCGLSAIKFDVIPSHQVEKSRNLVDILGLIDNSRLSPNIKEPAGKIFTRLAEAEAAVHGTSVDKVHFHEVGALDAIIDVVGSVIALNLLGVEKIISSPVNLGGGTVQSSHGHLPVPVPAVVELLKGKPVYSYGPEVELTTPTGAAVLCTLAEDFGPLPPMEINEIGRGAGSKDFTQMPNLLRVFIGSTEAEEDADTVAVLEANIDDMNPELYSPFMEKALTMGALDAFLTPIIMKKGRPGVKITILAPLWAEQTLRDLLFKETTTFGFRVRYEMRGKLKRESVEVDTIYGKVEVKIGKTGGKIIQISPEADSCLRVAAEKRVPLKSVYDEAKRAALILTDNS